MITKLQITGKLHYHRKCDFQLSKRKLGYRTLLPLTAPINSLCRTTYRRRQEQDKCNIAKGSRRGVTHTALDIDEIIDNFDRKLFSKIAHSGHCLHHLLPPKTSEHCSYSLRKRKHYY